MRALSTGARSVYDLGLASAHAAQTFVVGCAAEKYLVCTCTFFVIFSGDFIALVAQYPVFNQKCERTNC